MRYQFLLWKKCVWFSAPLSHSVRRGNMDAWVPPGNSYASFSNFRKVFHFQHCFRQNFSSQDANFPNFRSLDPSFFKENPLPRPYFWKPVWHTPTKKKLSTPPGAMNFTCYLLNQHGHFWPRNSQICTLPDFRGTPKVKCKVQSWPLRGRKWSPCF